MSKSPSKMNRDTTSPLSSKVLEHRRRLLAALTGSKFTMMRSKDISENNADDARGRTLFGVAAEVFNGCRRYSKERIQLANRIAESNPRVKRMLAWYGLDMDTFKSLSAATSSAAAKTLETRFINPFLGQTVAAKRKPATKRKSK